MNDLSRAEPVMRARELAPAIAESADEIERARCIIEPLLGELHKSRLFRMLYPRSVGAVPLDNWDPIGLRGTASKSYTVEDLFVPVSNASQIAM